LKFRKEIENNQNCPETKEITCGAKITKNTGDKSPKIPFGRNRTGNFGKKILRKFSSSKTNYTENQ